MVVEQFQAQSPPAEFRACQDFAAPGWGENNGSRDANEKRAITRENSENKPKEFYNMACFSKGCLVVV